MLVNVVVNATPRDESILVGLKAPNNLGMRKMRRKDKKEKNPRMISISITDNIP